MKEVEEEQRLKRLGPGGLDPVEVYQSLPKVNAFTHTRAQPFQGDLAELNVHLIFKRK